METGEKVRIKDMVTFQENGIVSRRIVESNSGGVTVFAFAVGQRLSTHTAPFDAVAVGVEGVGEITVGEITHRLNEGEAVFMPAHVPHAVNAPNNFKMMLIMIKL